MIGNINIRVSGDSNSVDVFGEDMAEVVFSDAGFAQVAAANGYIKADDYEALQKRLDELVNFIDGLDEDAIAVKAGYVKLEPGQVVVDEHPFTDEEADFLLEAIETTKCSDCDDLCKARGNCLYFNTRTKLETIKEARDE